MRQPNHQSGTSLGEAIRILILFVALQFIRTIGLARAEAKLTLCNLAYNFNRLIFHERRESMG